MEYVLLYRVTAVSIESIHYCTPTFRINNLILRTLSASLQIDFLAVSIL